jgi:hypothetical protein
MSQIGVLFDIDELDGGLYGFAAYKIFFEAVDTKQLSNCVLSDGDTNATLVGRANQYCIGVESFDDAQIAAIKKALSDSKAKGLLPVRSRFLQGELVQREPLVRAARIDATGKLIDCKTGWVREAWEKSQTREVASTTA